MSKKDRLIRVAALIITLRDELEELNIYPDWCEIANDFLDSFFKLNGKQEMEIYDAIFRHINEQINTVEKPCEVVNELIVILCNNLRRLQVKHSINTATALLRNDLNKVCTKKVKLLDSKIKIQTM